MADQTADETPAPIPVPPDFPVTWEHPDDERRSWTASGGGGYFPAQPKALIFAFSKANSEGFKRASQAFELPFTGSESRRINTYSYSAMLPTAPPEQMEAQGKRSEERLQAAIGRLSEWWETELLPEIKEHLAYWEAFDLRGAPMPALLAHLEDTWSSTTRLWTIKYLVAFAFIQAQSMFADLYGELFGTEGSLNAYRLLQGFGNKTVAGGHALWDLSRQALVSSQVRQILVETDPAAVPAALERSAEGRAFLDRLGAYLEEFGQRSDIFMALDDPHWIENPATAIKNLKDFISQPDRDLRSELAALAAERERLIAEARDQLKGSPQPVVEQFEFFLKTAQAGVVIQEDQNYWIDQRSTYKVRQVLLEFGRRLAGAGVIEQPDDVFFLSPEELRETASAMPSGDGRQLVAQHKAEMEHFRTIERPSALGAKPSGPPHTPPEHPLNRAFGKYAGAPPPASTEPDVLHGNPSSPGKARGTAKVIPSLAEAGKLQPGDIMVAPATMPAWTPLFATVAAVVTDRGGVLSHAAIVAREYNIPAVLGTGKATSLIKDGQTLEVDGNAGVVRIVA